MYKPVYKWLAVTAAIVLILTKTPLVFTVFALFVLGVIPGTTLTVPAWVFLLAYPALFFGMVYWLSGHPPLLSTKPLVPQKKTVRKRKPAQKQIRATTAKRRSRATA